MFVAERREVRKPKPRADRHFDRIQREPETYVYPTPRAEALVLNISFVHLVRIQSNYPPKKILTLTSPR